jgi:hypothetical protein
MFDAFAKEAILKNLSIITVLLLGLGLVSPAFAGSGEDHPNQGVGDVNQNAADNASDEGLINGMVGDCAA